MKTISIKLFAKSSLIKLNVVATGIFLTAASASAATLYVWQSSSSPAPPYTNWVTAAHVIQDAVDAAQRGDTVLVAGGAYATGGRAVGTNLLVNRVAIDRAIRVESLMGPEVTTIQGYQVPGVTNGDGAIRCVYLTNGASLSGFTLTKGATRIWSSGADDRELSGGGVWCESTNTVVSSCLVADNSADGSGGGAWGGMLNHCTLSGNSASSGGGAAGGTLYNCLVTGNSAGHCGGGADGCTLNNCVLSGNSAGSGGGGASWSMLNNCTLTGNSANGWAGGGGAFEAMLNNCTLTGNSASVGGGAVAGPFGTVSMNNCIVYFNSAQGAVNNYGYGSILNYCCTTPLPAGGTGNISLDPQLASASHLSAASPCRGAGSAAYATGSDIDGEAWATPPSMGCDEYHAGAITGPLSVSILGEVLTVTAGWPAELTALIEGRTTASAWEFGDGLAVSNRPFAAHAWAATGDYLVTVWAYNESHPAGVSDTLAVHVVPQTTHFVSVGSTNPLPPYNSWATAATNIQDAVDAAPLPGALILVTNGVYGTGGRPLDGMTNRVAVDKPLIVRSVNGPEFTVIQGQPGTTNFDDAIRCAYLTSGASLTGFTLTNGGAWRGGGLLCESEASVVSNCVVVGNSSGEEGGGVLNGTLNNCALIGNSASDSGGGAGHATLNNCTLTGNSATTGHRGYGGGAAWATLNNCTLVGNSANIGGGAIESSLNNCVLTGNSAQDGGGAMLGTLNNCTLTGNSAEYEGGGAYRDTTLNNCTLTGNSANYSGGGVYDSKLNNCIVYFNSAPTGPNYENYENGPPNYCCTTPQPTGGVGNITQAPLFVDYANGNLRLQSNSPCINAGNNAYAPGPTELDGNPRIVSGTVDIGAYEFQGPGSVISYAWLQQYGLPTDGSADATDPDRDGMNNWQEWRCQTDPTNALSALRLLTASPGGTNVTVSWQSVAGVNYFLERTTNLWASPPFTLLSPNLPGQPGTTTFTDTNAAALAPLFYRVGVGP